MRGLPFGRLVANRKESVIADKVQDSRHPGATHRLIG
jgi:hypothetical protein